MKLRNPVKERRERKAEEKRRKAEEEKKKQKRLLGIAVGFLVFAFIVIGIGTLTEDHDSPPTDSSAQVETTEAPTTAPTSQPEETQPTETPIETETPTESVPPAESIAPPETTEPQVTAPVIDLASIPAFSGDPYVVLNDNVPEFSDSDLTTSSFETYSNLDSLGRCGMAYACIGTDLMPTEERGSIGQVKPSGWHTIKYDNVDGKYLYNRCHLIGYQLTAENANTQNLITGTRYLNVDGMLPFENMVADYIKETGNHVLYRVTPIFEGNNLLANGVHMEAESVEDNGDGILYNVYCYNVQPGIIINYATGDSESDGTTVTEPSSKETEVNTKPEEPNPPASSTATYILNNNTHKFHYPSCSSVGQMSDKNKEEFTGTRDEAIAMGYDPCGRCNP